MCAFFYSDIIILKIAHSNQNSGAIPKIPKFVQSAESLHEPVSKDESLALILYNDMSADTYRRMTKMVNQKVKNLDWQLEKFRVNIALFKSS